MRTRLYVYADGDPACGTRAAASAANDGRRRSKAVRGYSRLARTEYIHVAKV